MASMDQRGHQRGSRKKEKMSKVLKLPDLSQVTMLTRAELQRIQDEVNQIDRAGVREEAENRRKALHLRSQQMVKEWPNTIARQRQKQLEAKQIREQMKEERRRQIDIEETEHREEERRKVIEKGKIQLFDQTDRVKGLHSALLMTEVLKVREAQIEMNKRAKNATKDVEKEYRKMAEMKKDEALRREEETTLQRKLEGLAVAEEQRNQMRKSVLVREQQVKDIKKEREEYRQLHERYLLEQRMKEDRLEEQKRVLAQAQREYVAARDLLKASEIQKQAAEEEQRKLFVAANEKAIKLRKEKAAELFREEQKKKEEIVMGLAAQRKQQADREEERIAKAIAERDAKREQQLREEEAKRAVELKAVNEHREQMREENKRRIIEEEKIAREIFEAKKEANRLLDEKEKAKIQRTREDLRKIQDFNTTLTATKAAKQQQQKREEDEYHAKTRDLVAEEEKQFQLYSQQVIHAAAGAKRDVFPLCKAAREGIGGGLGPLLVSVRPSYMVQKHSGAELPDHISGAGQNVKVPHGAGDMQETKKKLGFIW